MNENHTTPSAGESDSDDHPAGTIRVLPWRRPNVRNAALAGLMIGASLVSAIVYGPAASVSSPGG